MNLIKSILISALITVSLSGCGIMLNPHVTSTKYEPAPDKPNPKSVAELNLPYKPVPKEGEGVVIVDIIDYGGKVSLIESIKRGGVTLEGYGAVGAEGGVSRADMQVKLLGSTPCAFTLPFGSHQLLFESPSNGVWPSSTDVIDIVVTDKPQQITHIMSRYNRS